MNIIITGASKGIGYDTALKLAKSQENKVLALSRDASKLKELAAQSNNIEYLSFDITSPEIDALLQKVEAMGGVDILLNNAGLLIN